MDKETSEIAKLTGRISKDPKSKLFVPLAEEYKKAGDIEMAIYVLLEGLKSNPEYVTARSSLGKLLLAKGDLAGAQREFEEVVKTNPDNLLARKKLGDLYILQNRPHDALPHYKIALSLNPGDGELASLVSDVEAGRDVRSRIQALKTKTFDEKVVKQESPASVASPEPAPAVVPAQPSNVEPKAPVGSPLASQEVSTAPLAAMAQALSRTVAETEEPEEVLVVEPLEDIPAPEPPAIGIDLPGGLEPGEVPSDIAKKVFDFDFSESDQLSNAPAVSQDIRSGSELFNVGDRGPVPTGTSEEIAANKTAEPEFEEVVERFPEPSFEGTSEKSDDFTTDTLAELYISQGFFEKAVEIYERMLIDKPDSRGLQDKLSWVRAEVARTAAPVVSEGQKETDIFAAQEATEYVPAAEAGETSAEPLEAHWPQQKEETDGFTPEAFTPAGESVPAVEPEEMIIEAEIVAEPDEFGSEETSSEENIVAGSLEHEPSSVPKEQTPAGEDAGFDVLADSPAQARPGPELLHRDFEPREYVPPEMEPSSQSGRATHVLSLAERKETIARLESWLTTIKKEK